MADIVENTTIAEDGKDLLLSQLKGKTRFEALLTAILTPLQTIERDIFLIRFYQNLDNAVDDMLDKWGEMVGISRQGRANDEYRIQIKAKIAINVSKGTIDEVASIFNLITGATYTEVYETFPRQVDLYCNLDLSTYLVSDTESFAFDGGIDGEGYGDLFDSTTGGEWATLASIIDSDYLYAIMDKVLAAGYRIGIITYSPATGESFSFDGGSDGGGYGSLDDSSLGGSWATIF